ncbi:D-(-)-3-hydroxybutyrate oligomer hydrolase [Paraburkholderia ginsengiterrae]|uniref:D-(-)-3-hydroxybutyrate oligomer hydrolase n=2 Tax=Paraburkholderia ginsengiterrae TaxID=1462993 RepID=A0A1A9N382_9BURK|nr:D-(-)-3-hydroxybutyrate oligomer hydrolase [Paraburkholderia ginsengiterrae]OAJ53272.1 D-(-)-3-hydroxybutyrate oligomer hydrolase [Paraburkholderia ginsengiterrae]OAJ55908.1 D-(-)-3-hydroxybutyrate oligomer hydrolase [Paraburkholderia ginsengiterrae]
MALAFEVKPAPPSVSPVRALLAACLSMAVMLTGCHSGGSESNPPPQANVLPAFITSAVNTQSYDGNSDDLLTAGLGKTGLASATAPAIANPAQPTAAELRRLAIWSNYRALVDMTANGGYGRFWGPNIDVNGNDTLGEGKITGKEYLAFADDGSGTQNVSMLVQIPASFNPNQPCIVTATSSGSRGVYGAISAAGEWGLKRGCAVAYTDKGSGNGAHELSTNRITLIDGTLQDATAAGKASLFTANLGNSNLTTFNSQFPNRYAFKHAHSQQNPEKDWGTDTLEAIQFAYWALNDSYGALNGSTRTVRYASGSITTIAASVSNGGGASLAAAEQDTSGLITAVVVGEPQINLRLSPLVAVAQGGVPVAAFGKPLADYTTLANMLQPCAALAPAAAGAPYLSALPLATTNSIRTARCATMAAAGVITGGDVTTQAVNALALLHQYGYQTDSDLLQAPMWDSQAVPAVAVTYANAYIKASVADNLCNFSFGTTNAAGTAGVTPAVSPMLTVFGTGNGVPPTNGVNLVYNVGAGADHRLATADGSYAGAFCLRALWTNNSLSPGVEAIRVNANLHGKPAIIVQGRADALVPINHASRPYLGLNQLNEGGASKLSLYEVTNGQHFDAFLGVAGFDTRFVPVHYYNLQALNLMWSHLMNGTPLPPSQVIHTVPRGGTPGAAPPLTTANLPAIAASPGANAITVVNGAVNVPN